MASTNAPHRLRTSAAELLAELRRSLHQTTNPQQPTINRETATGQHNERICQIIEFSPKVHGVGRLPHR